VLSEGTPMFKVSPSTVIKSIESEAVSADEKTMLEPEIEYESKGA